MTDRQYVIYFCKVNNLDLLKPTNLCKDIIVMCDSYGEYKMIAEGTTWTDIRIQLNAWLYLEIN